MNYFLIFAYFVALGLFAYARPGWRQIGPSLLDSFVIGLSLYAVGSVLVWVEGLPDSEAMMRIGVATALSGIVGASLWGLVLASRIAGLNFFADAKRFAADPIEHFVISTGFVVASLVSVILLIAVFSHEHIRSLLLGALLQNAGTLNEARIIVSSGAEGYFAPGYVKQFRDIIVPILCVAVILCDGAYRHRGLFFVALLIALASIFISGQRLVIVQYMLCIGAAFVIVRYAPRPPFRSLLAGLLLSLLLLGAVGAMSKMLGRLDVPLSPLTEQQRQKMRQDFVAAQTVKLNAALQQASTAREKLRAAQASESQVQLTSVQKQLADAEATVAELKRAIVEVEQGGQLPAGVMGLLESPNIPAFIQVPIALVHRAIVAVPRENTITYPLWAVPEHAPGAGWLTDMGSIRPGAQKQLSNELSAANKGSGMGNSPLGLPSDIFYNWGWPGVIFLPALYAFGFLWLDIALTASRSPLTSAAKIFMFFSIPLMYSPFMFVLYGGFVAVGILCYAHLRRRGALSFLDALVQARP